MKKIYLIEDLDFVVIKPDTKEDGIKESYPTSFVKFVESDDEETDRIIAEEAAKAKLPLAGSYTGDSIKPRIRAISAGATRNNNVYLRDKLQGGEPDPRGNPSGVESWYTPYAKPILINHDTYTDPLGRVLGKDDVEFVDGGRKNTGVDIMPVITDPQAIEKIKSGRYLTGSIGVESDSAVCTICGMDMVREGNFCDHIKGKRYNKKTKELDPEGTLCQWILGNVWFSEYSFVNRPADQTSGVRIVDTKEFVESHDGEEEGSMNDALSEAKLSYGARKNLPDSAFCGPNRSFPAHDAAHVRNALARLGQSKVKAGAAKGNKAKTLACLRGRAKKFGIKVGGKEVDTAYADLFGEFGLLTKTDEEIEKILAEPWTKEDEQWVAELEAEEATLSTQKRKSLADSVFCGPGRSWPVPDCKHVTVAKAMLNWPNVKKKLSDAQRASILACVNKKAAAMKCGKESEEDDIVEAANFIEMTIDDCVETFKKEEKPAETVGCGTDKCTTPPEVEPEPETSEQKVERLEEELKLQTLACENLAVEVNAKDEEIGVLKEEISTLKGQVESLQTQAAAIQEENEKLAKSGIEGLVSSIVDIRIKNGATESKEELFNMYIKRSEESLKDTLSDLQIQGSTGVQSLPEATPAVEGETGDTTTEKHSASTEIPATASRKTTETKLIDAFRSKDGEVK